LGAWFLNKPPQRRKACFLFFLQGLGRFDPLREGSFAAYWLYRQNFLGYNPSFDLQKSHSGTN
jgi:hypothetical protein